MKTYSLSCGVPQLVSESTFAFTFLLHDRADEVEKHEKEVLLEHYFNDIYHLFLSRFSKLPVVDQVSLDDADALKSLLEEIIRVKKILGS